MKYVDLSNPVAREAIAEFNKNHAERLKKLQDMLPQFAAESRQHSSLPLAAVFDIDEVLLSNIHGNQYVTANEKFYAADFFYGADGKPWPRGSPIDPPLGGATSLLRAVAALNIEPHLVTGRAERLRGETVKSLVAGGLAGPGAPLGDPAADPAAWHARLHMCPDDKVERAEAPGGSMSGFKTRCRRDISATRHITLNLGDQLSDLGLYGDNQILVNHPFYFTA